MKTYLMADPVRYPTMTTAQLRETFLIDCLYQPGAIGLAYVDPEARIDFADVRRQIAWFKAQNMLKPEVEAEQILDTRYAVPLPEN